MAENGEEAQENRPVPRLNERILSSLSRRSVAAHPWHDLEIGTVAQILYIANLHSVYVIAQNLKHVSKICRTGGSSDFQLCKFFSSDLHESLSHAK